MDTRKVRAEIVANGLVQGVGFRYFVSNTARELKLNGYVKNLYSGEVITVVEGPKVMVEDLYKQIKIGPRSAHVKNATIKWQDNKNEFNDFAVRY